MSDKESRNLNENKFTIHKASDKHLSTYINLIKMKGISSPAEKELHDLAQKEHASRILKRTLTSPNIGEETINERKIGKPKVAASITQDKFIGTHPHSQKQRLSQAASKWRIANQVKPIKENAPTCSMGTSSSTQGTGAITTFDPIFKPKRLLKRFKDIKNVTPKKA